MESNKNRRVPPLVIQCFVTSGVSLNMAGMGLVSGFSNGLLPQLRRPESNIAIDDASASWIASLPGLTLVLGNLFMPAIMSKLGRRTANLCSLAVAVAGWLSIVFSNSVTLLIFARLFQGIGMGMSAIFGPALIGEYTSPKYRGMFLMTISISVSISIFVVQALGEYLPWKTCALICIGYVLFNIVIVLFSPESPTFLAEKKRYDECRKVFRYLRGDNEDEELENIIATQMMANKIPTKKLDSFNDKIMSKWVYIKQSLKKKEFYKPLLIITHTYFMAQWTGVNVLTSFSGDMFEKVIGSESGVDISIMIMLVGVHRIIGNSLGLILIKTLKRRVVLFSTMGLNVASLLVIAAYTYAKDNNVLPFDQPAVGILLVHIHMFSIATGAIPLAFVLAGELFSLEFKAISGGISTIFFSLGLFSNVKTVIVCLNSWGIYGTYCLYAGVLVYCLAVIGFLLPETKDKTLQDIEEEFRDKRSSFK